MTHGGVEFIQYHMILQIPKRGELRDYPAHRIFPQIYRCRYKQQPDEHKISTTGSTEAVSITLINHTPVSKVQFLQFTAIQNKSSLLPIIMKAQLMTLVTGRTKQEASNMATEGEVYAEAVNADVTMGGIDERVAETASSTQTADEELKVSEEKIPEEKISEPEAELPASSELTPPEPEEPTFGKDKETRFNIELEVRISPCPSQSRKLTSQSTVRPMPREPQLPLPPRH